MTSQAPHVHRTVFALVAGLPEQKIRIISPDIGGGFGNKVPVYPGYVVATAASLLIGRPVKWIEDRTGNLISTGFARDYYMNGELALDDDGKMLGLRVKMLSDQGVRLRRRAADEVPGRPVPHRHRLVRPPAAHVVTRRRVHEQGAGRRRIPLLVPRHRGVVLDRAARADGGVRARHRPGRAAAGRTSSGRSSSRITRRPASSTTRATTSARSTSRCEELGYDELREEQRAAREEGRLIGIGDRELHRGRRRRARARTTTSSGSRCSTRRSCACTRRARRSSSSASSRRARATRRRSRRSSPRSSASRPRTSLVVEGDTDNTPYGLGTYASRSTPTAARRRR